MQLVSLRTKTRAILLSFIAIIAFLLFLRITFELVEANAENGFVDAIYQVTDMLLAPVDGAVELKPSSELKPFNFDALIAIAFYVLGGLIFIEILTGIMHDEAEEIVQNVVDAFFKLFEFVLTLKIIFVLFDVGIPKSTAPWTISLIYDLTSWTNIFGKLNFVYEKIDWSAIVVLIIIVVFDVLSEQMLEALFSKDGNVKVKQKVTVQPRPAQQNITINVPASPPPQQNITVQSGSSPFGGSQR